MKRWIVYTVLVPAIAAAAYVVAVRFLLPPTALDNSEAGKPTMKTEGEAVPREILDLRRQHQLRPLAEFEQGKQMQQLPKGVYGYSTCAVSSVSAKRENRSLIEVHKHLDGIIYYVGYASKEDLEKYLTRQKKFHILTSPSSRGAASLLFEIPVDFVFKCETRPSREGDLYDLFIAAIPELHS